MTTPAARLVARRQTERLSLDLTPAPTHTRTIRLAPGQRFGPLRMIDHGLHTQQVALLSPISTPQGSTLSVAGCQIEVSPGEVHFVDVARGVCIDNPTPFERVDLLYSVATTHPLTRALSSAGLGAEPKPLLGELPARRLLRSLPTSLQHSAEGHGAPLLAALRHAQATGSLRRVSRARVQGQEIEAEVLAPAEAMASLCAWLAPGRPPQATPLPWTHLRRAIRQGMDQVDLCLVLVPRAASSLLPAGFVRAPGSVSVRADTIAALRKWTTGAAPLGKYRRRALREGIRVDILHSAEALHRAHFDFYRPFLEHKFGAAGNPHSLAAYAGYDWEVLAARSAGDWVAAGTTLIHHDRYRFLSLGYAEGQQGASHALYAAAVERAAQLSLPCLDLGPERPFLGNPVLGYKAQWGAKIQSDPWRTGLLGIGYRKRTPGLDALLQRSPLIVFDGVHLAHMSPHPAEFSRTIGPAPHAPPPAAAGR